MQSLPTRNKNAVNYASAVMKRKRYIVSHDNFTEYTNSKKTCRLHGRRRKGLKDLVGGRFVVEIYIRTSFVEKHCWYTLTFGAIINDVRDLTRVKTLWIILPLRQSNQQWLIAEERRCRTCATIGKKLHEYTLCMISVLKS